MTKLEIQCSEVLFGDVDYGFPIAKPVLGQCVEICRESNALKYFAQFRHGVGRWGKGKDRHESRVTWVSSAMCAEGRSAYLRNANCFPGLAGSGPGSLRAREAEEGCMMCSRDSIQPVQPVDALGPQDASKIANQTTVALNPTRGRIPARRYQISSRCDTSCARFSAFPCCKSAIPCFALSSLALPPANSLGRCAGVAGSRLHHPQAAVSDSGGVSNLSQSRPNPPGSSCIVGLLLRLLAGWDESSLSSGAPIRSSRHVDSESYPEFEWCLATSACSWTVLSRKFRLHECGM